MEIHGQLKKKFMEIDGNSSKIIEAAYGNSRKFMRSLWELMENSKKFVKFMEI